MFVRLWAEIQLLGAGGMMKITEVLSDYFAPDAIVSVNQEVVRFSHFKRTTPTTGGYPVRPDSLRRRTESRARVGGLSSETFGSNSCMRNAPLS